MWKLARSFLNRVVIKKKGEQGGRGRFFGGTKVSGSSGRSPTATKRSNYTGRSAAITEAGLPLLLGIGNRVGKAAAYHPTSQFLPDNANNIGHPLCGNRQSRILIKVNYFCDYLPDYSHPRIGGTGGDRSASIVQDSKVGSRFALSRLRSDGMVRV